MKMSLFYLADLAKAPDSYLSGLVKISKVSERVTSSKEDVFWNHTTRPSCVSSACTSRLLRDVCRVAASKGLGKRGGRQAVARKRKSSFRSVANFVVSYTSLLSLQYQIKYTLPIHLSPDFLLSEKHHHIYIAIEQGERTFIY
jgi:hypothetical protein